MIDPLTGALAPVAGSPFAAPPFSTSPVSTQWASAVAPSGRFAYFTSTVGVLAYAIGTNGALTALAGSPFPLPGSDTEILAVAVDPTGRYLYAVGFDSVVGNFVVWGFAIDPATGSLAAVPGSPFNAGGSSFDIAEGAVVDASGRFLYVGTGFDGTVQAFAIASDTGALTLVPGAPFGDPSSNVYGVAVTGRIQFE